MFFCPPSLSDPFNCCSLISVGTMKHAASILPAAGMKPASCSAAAERLSLWINRSSRRCPELPCWDTPTRRLCCHGEPAKKSSQFSFISFFKASFNKLCRVLEFWVSEAGGLSQVCQEQMELRFNLLWILIFRNRSEQDGSPAQHAASSSRRVYTCSADGVAHTLL